MRCALLVITLAACRFGFDERTGGDGGDPTGDGARGDANGPDVAFGDCWSAWRTGPLGLSAPQPVATLNTQVLEGDPSLSADALALYFTRQTPTAGDIFVATRPDRFSPFGAATPVTGLNTPEDETKVSLTGDGLVAIWSTNRTGSQGYDLWESVRTSPTAAFTTTTQAPFAQVNDNQNQFDPHLSSDGLRLYLAPQRMAAQIIQLTTRGSLAASFSTPVDVLGLGLARTVDPSLSPDELVIVYSAHSNTQQPLNLWYATRASTADPFSNAQRLPNISDGSIHDQDPMVSFDGCEVYFSSRRSGIADLYVSVVQ